MIVLTDSALKDLVEFSFINKLRMLAFGTFKLHCDLLARSNICAEVDVCTPRTRQLPEKRDNDR